MSASSLPPIGAKVIAWSPTFKKNVPCQVTAHKSATKFWAIDRDYKTLTGLSKWKYPDPEILEICDDLPKLEEPEICEILTKTEEPEIYETITEPEQSEICENLTKIDRGWIDPNLIIFDAGTQTRNHNDQSRIDLYGSRMIENDWDFEREPLPIFVFNGTNYYPVTGNHRGLAAKQSGFQIFGEIYHGDLDRAIYLSIRDGSNAGHGLTESSSDRRSRIIKFFNLFETWTDERKESELKNIDMFPANKSIKHFTGWSVRAIACYLRVPFCYNQVKTIKDEFDLAKKLLETSNCLKVDKFYQWRINDQVFTGKAIYIDGDEFKIGDYRFYSWSPGILEFCDSVFEIDEPIIEKLIGNDESDTDESNLDESDLDESDLDESTLDESDLDESDLDESDLDESDLDFSKSYNKLRTDCYKFSTLEFSGNKNFDHVEIAYLIESLSVWAEENNFSTYSLRTFKAEIIGRLKN